MRALSMLVCLTMCSTLARAADAPYEGLGRAPIANGDRVKARDRALDEAFQHVVEAAVSALLGPETLTRRASDMRLKVLPHARSYVTSYRMLDEGETEPGFFTVHVGADVQAERLVHELAAPTPSRSSTPTAAAHLAICVRAAGQPAPLPRLEEALRSRLDAQGIIVVPSSCDEQKWATEGLRAALFAELTAGELSPIRGTSLVGRDVQLVLRIVEPQGRRSAEGRGQGAGYGATPLVALDDAAMAALPEATPPIDDALAQLGPHAAAAGQLIVHAAGVRKLAQLTVVRSALERVPGVDGVELRRVTANNGPVDLAVRTSLSSHALFEALSRVAPTYRIVPREENGSVIVDVPDASDALPPTGTP